MWPSAFRTKTICQTRASPTSRRLQWTPFPEARPPPTRAEPTLPHPRHRPHNEKFPLWRGLRRAQNLSFASTALALPYAFTLSIVWALNVRMQTEADLTALRTTAGTWFHTFPVLRVIETNFEPIPVGLVHTFRPFALGCVVGGRVKGSTRVVFFLRSPLPAFDDGSPPTAVTACSNACVASMGIPALEPIDPRMPIAMNSTAASCVLSSSLSKQHALALPAFALAEPYRDRVTVRWSKNASGASRDGSSTATASTTLCHSRGTHT